MTQSEKINESLDKLRIKGLDNIYSAGLPHYNRNFSRDSFIYGLLADDYQALVDQVAYSAHYQGKKQDPLSGEEPGKIHHEMPGKVMRGLETTYNACDTTALFLIAIARLFKIKKDRALIKSYHANIDQAIIYILSHLKDDLFWEDPSLSGSKRFALNVTYWKDSVLNYAKNKPSYPIVYTVAHFQNSYALIEIGKLLKDKTLVRLGKNMIKAALKELWKQDHFITAMDSQKKIIDPISTDSLYSLFFINKKYFPINYAYRIQKYSRRLETHAGYRSGLPDTKNHSSDQYHIHFVWVYEQAVINYVAKNYHLKRAYNVTRNIIPYLKDGFTEELDVSRNYKAASDPLQLWSIGAAEYFNV